MTGLDPVIQALIGTGRARSGAPLDAVWMAGSIPGLDPGTAMTV
jgi:hypothetical protein